MRRASSPQLANERIENTGLEDQELQGKQEDAAHAAAAAEPAQEEERDREVVSRTVCIKNNPLSVERFAVVVVKNMHLLFNAWATQQNLGSRDRAQALEDTTQAAGAARGHLASIWRWSLQKYYDRIWHEAVEAQGREAADQNYAQLFETAFDYPPEARVQRTTLGSLVYSSDNTFLEFLNSLHGEFAFSTHGDPHKHPAQRLRDCMETYVLPFAVVWPLVSYGRAAINRAPPQPEAAAVRGKATSSKGKGKRAPTVDAEGLKRPRTEAEAAKADSGQRPQQGGVRGPKYVLDIPVYLPGEHRWGTVREDLQEQQGITHKQMLQQSPDSNMLKLTVCNPKLAARRGGHQMIGQALDSLFVSLQSHLADSVDFPTVPHLSLIRLRGNAAASSAT